MILRRPLLSLTSANTSVSKTCTRELHHRIPLRPIPQPTPFIPDYSTFLSVIGRNLSAHTSKIPSWEALFTLSSTQLRELGIEPARSRRYLLHWREKFRNGEYGIGGDIKHIDENGIAQLRMLEVPVREGLGGRRTSIATATHTPGTRKVVVNVREGEAVPEEASAEVSGVEGVVVKGAKTICGPFVETVKGTDGLGARLVRKEGIWEEKRGRIIDGGERRRAEVRAKRRAAENKEKRR